MSQRAKIILFCAVAGFIGLLAAFKGAATTLFLHAPLSSAHARLEADCQACHEPWNGATSEKCLSCHKRNLAHDTHSKERLINPVKAKPVDRLKEASCIECHREHQPVKASGYTGPEGLCAKCHPPESLPPGRHFSGEKGSCQKAGCHRYHTNITYREIAYGNRLRFLQTSKIIAKKEPAPYKKLDINELERMRKDSFYSVKPAVTSRYEISRHSGGEATCGSCHKSENGSVELAPKVTVCLPCHKTETKTFLNGAHGAAERSHNTGAFFGHETGERVTCGSCHDSHSLRLEDARIKACEKCHDSAHSKSYRGSGHYRYLSDPTFASKKLTGVDCAGCHMPRLHETGGATDHNESLSVSTKERMARTVCVQCHGLYFSLSSLYNDIIVTSNFTYSPKSGTEQIEYAFRNTKKIVSPKREK